VRWNKLKSEVTVMWQLWSMGRGGEIRFGYVSAASVAPLIPCHIGAVLVIIWVNFPLS